MKLPALFCENMVLQQGMPIPVWGWGDAGETIAVEIAGQTAQTVAGADGRWRVTLPALSAGGPHTLTVRGSATVTLQNVLVGEVWVCSGQSNMEWPVQSVNNALEEVAAAAYPRIRLFTVPKVPAGEPQTDVEGCWSVCSPQTIEAFSAVGYFFGRELHRDLDVPIGLINSSWGGTVAEAWTSREGLYNDPGTHNIIEFYEDDLLPNYEQHLAHHRELIDAWNVEHATDPEHIGLAQGWADPQTDISAWPTMPVPGTWQSIGHKFSGVFWFRRTVDIPAEWAGYALELRVGACDKDDITYFNGTQVGSLTHDMSETSWCTPRNYTVPASLVQAGANVIAVRVFSFLYDGGMIGPAAQMHVVARDLPGAQPIPLAGDWQYQIEHNLGQVASPPAAPAGPGNQNAPCTLFNGMIAPLIPYGIRGAIWYQGESNESRPRQYRSLFRALIRDWRAQWGEGDFPFYFVQLANFRDAKAQPGDSQWAEIREAQMMALQEPHTGMAVIIDIGEAGDIHPRNKQDVGRRLALNALAQTYGKTGLAYSGPLFREMQLEERAIRVAFDHADGGLIAKDGALAGFAIAGEDRKFVWADARIEGDSVVLSNPDIIAPVAVRYGWADNPPCTLYNAAGLPASPFRTDDWSALEPSMCL